MPYSADDGISAPASERKQHGQQVSIIYTAIVVLILIEAVATIAERKQHG